MLYILPYGCKMIKLCLINTTVLHNCLIYIFTIVVDIKLVYLNFKTLYVVFAGV